MDLPKIPLRVRFPNRYTGGYNSSTVTEKLKYQTIATVQASSKRSYLSKNSDQGGGSAIAIKANPCCSME